MYPCPHSGTALGLFLRPGGNDSDYSQKPGRSVKAAWLPGPRLVLGRKWDGAAGGMAWQGTERPAGSQLVG